VAVTQDVKYCFSDDTLPDGYAVKKGDMVNYQPYPMGRMTFLWGADAKEFRPERWLDDNGVFVPESPFKFTAFQVTNSGHPASSDCFFFCKIQLGTLAFVSCNRRVLASAWEKSSRTGR
jgi:hypothetical protein